jgi:hypothetical protein
MPSKNIYYVVAGLVILVLLGYTLEKGHAPHTPAEWLAPLGPAVTGSGILLWLWDRYIWRWCGIRKLAGRPILHGTWHGELASDWIDPETKNCIAPDPDVFLVVRQRFWSLSARLLTKESASYAIVADFKKDPDGVHELMYVYSNTPRHEVRYRSAMHFGTALLSAPRDGSDRLEGRYFTERRTGGELRFTRRLPKLVESHAGGVALLAAASTPEK